MSKGYAEGSALEERLADLERSKRERRAPAAPLRPAGFGSTARDAQAHLLGLGGGGGAPTSGAGSANGARRRRLCALRSSARRPTTPRRTSSAGRTRSTPTSSSQAAVPTGSSCAAFQDLSEPREIMIFRAS